MNSTIFSNITSLQGLAYYTNNAVDGILFGGGLIVLFFVILLVTIRQEVNVFSSVAVASWTAFILGVLFWYAHLIPALEVLVFLIITVISTVMLFTNKP